MIFSELEPNAQSIKKLTKYLETISFDEDEFGAGIAALMRLYQETGQQDLAFHTGTHYLEQISNLKSKVILLDALIHLSLLVGDFKQAKQWIDHKGEFVNQSERSLIYTKDMVLFSKIKKDDTDFIRFLLVLLDYDLSKEERANIILDLIQAYARCNHGEKMLEMIEILKKISLQLALEEYHYEALYYEAYYYFLEQQYPTVLYKIDQAFKQMELASKLKAKVVLLKMKSFCALEQFRQASILESEEESLILTSSEAVQKEFFALCMELYHALNNKLSYDLYAKRLQELSKKEPENQKVTKPKRKIQSVIFEKQKREDPKAPLRKYSYIEQASRLDEFQETWDLLFDSVKGMKFRDILRLLGMEVQDKLVFSEIVVAYYYHEWEGYHYKKERVYEKQFASEEIDRSIVGMVMREQVEQIILNTEELGDILDIITRQPITKQSVLGFPLLRQERCIGAVLFTHSSPDMIDTPLNYELLQLIAKSISLRLNIALNELEQDEKYQTYRFLVENMGNGYKQEMDGYIYCSERVQKMFQVYPVVSRNTFLSKIASKDTMKYRKALEDLNESNVVTTTVKYELEFHPSIKKLEEKFFKTTKNGKQIIYSIIEDISNQVHQEETLKNMVEFDERFQIPNSYKLRKDLVKFLEQRKFSLTAFNIKDFKLYNEIYGYEFGDSILKELARFLKNYPKEEFYVYYYYADYFLFVLNHQNDKRSTVQILKKIANDVTEHFFQINSRVKLQFAIGVLRIPTDTQETNAERLIHLALDAGLDSQGSQTEIVLYSKEAYQTRFQKNQLATHIAESIHHHQLGVLYSQTVNMKDNEAEFFTAHFQLSSYAVPVEELYRVIARRNLEYTLDKYLIHKVFFEMSEIYRNIQVLPRVCLKLFAKTLESSELVTYLQEQSTFFQIPLEALLIQVDDSFITKYEKNMKDLKRKGVLLGTSNIEICKKIEMDYFFYDSSKETTDFEDQYLKQLVHLFESQRIKLIITGVHHHQILAKYAQFGIQYYSGGIFRDKISYQNIIENHT